jgi:PIN domain nuclease of toxin-antitoxin system
MSFLLDTQILLWSQGEPYRLPDWLVVELERPDIAPIFSTISIWEVVIKTKLGKIGFDYDPADVRQILIARGWQELQFSSAHALEVLNLPQMHGDPFDHALVAQAKAEGLQFVTSDRILKDYGAHVRLI